MNRSVIAIAVVAVGGVFAAGMATIAIFIVWAVMASDKKIEFGNQSELYYSANVSREEAQSVANYLESMQQELDLNKQVSYRLDRIDGRLTFGAVVLDEYEHDLLTMTFMLSLTGQISDECFQGEKMDFYAYDRYFKVKRILTAEEGMDALVSDMVPPQDLAKTKSFATK